MRSEHGGMEEYQGVYGTQPGFWVSRDGIYLGEARGGWGWGGVG